MAAVFDERGAAGITQLQVTQLHTRDNRKGAHEMTSGATAQLHGNQEDDFIVTSDGMRHDLDVKHPF